MAKFKLTNKAVDDLALIWNCTIHKWSGNQVDNYYRMLIDNFSEIANNPDLGKSYSGVIENLRGFKVGRHIIFFRKMEDDVKEITRILHAQMDLKNRAK